METAPYVLVAMNIMSVQEAEEVGICIKWKRLLRRKRTWPGFFNFLCM